jgi:hypothetical protein
LGSHQAISAKSQTSANARAAQTAAKAEVGAKA